MADDPLPGDPYRLNVVLNNDAADAIERLRERTGRKKVDLVNSALPLFEFVDAEIRAGRTVAVVDADGNSQTIKLFY